MIDIQTLLVSFAKNTINKTISSCQSSELIKVSWKLKKQIDLQTICKNEKAIPHITEMIKIKTLISDELTRRIQ